MTADSANDTRAVLDGRADLRREDSGDGMESESLEELRGKGSSTGVADEEEDKLDVEADLSSSLSIVVE